MDATKFARIVETHTGTVTAQDDKGLTRVEFTDHLRACGFYDEMVSRRIPTNDDYQVGQLTVIVQL